MAGMPNFIDIVHRLQHTMGPLWHLITGGAFLMGLFFALKSIYTFKEYGEMRVMMSSSTDVRKPLGYLLIAIILMYVPFVGGQVTHTIFGSNSFNYISGLGISGQDFKDTVNLMGNIIEFIGMIAFIRGWILIVHTVNQQSQPGGFSKGLMHLIAGVLALNIFGTIKVLQATIGWGS